MGFLSSSAEQSSAGRFTHDLFSWISPASVRKSLYDMGLGLDALAAGLPVGYSVAAELYSTCVVPKYVSFGSGGFLQ